jgi:hypothetical protein
MAPSEIHGGHNCIGTVFFTDFFSFPLLIINLPLLQTHLSPPDEVCDSPDQAAHYHTQGTKSGTLSLIRNLAGLGVKVL